jgi:hypothetical protein
MASTGASEQGPTSPNRPSLAHGRARGVPLRPKRGQAFRVQSLWGNRAKDPSFRMNGVLPKGWCTMTTQQTIVLPAAGVLRTVAGWPTVTVLSWAGR